MTTTELLQQLGLNKYEAEAYYTLLMHGPLTGYEVGKRSHVPLSRVYEILERLLEKGLALIQPGDPPRYTAQDPQQFLGQVRSSMEATLQALAASLAALPRSGTDGEFWVARGRRSVLARAQTIIGEAQSALALSLPPDCDAALADALTLAQQRGCRIFRSSAGEVDLRCSISLLLLRDNRQALVGTVAPVDMCQAVISSNQGLIAALQGYFTHQQPIEVAAFSATPASEQQEVAWLDWETRKQRRLWRLNLDNRVA